MSKVTWILFILAALCHVRSSAITVVLVLLGVLFEMFRHVRNRVETVQYSTAERIAVIPCVLLGIAAAAVLSPKDSYFFGNFVFYWLPHAFLLGILLTITSRPAVLSGTAVILAAYLAAFGAWVFSRAGPDASLGWIIYFYCLPGAAIGAIVGAIYIKKRSYLRATAVGAIAALSTFIGLSLPQLFICSTIMQCRIE